MVWRPLGLTKRGAARRRILAALGPKDAGPPQGTFSILPQAPVADAFTKLAQQNLDRLKGIEEEDLAKQRLADLRKSEAWRRIKLTKVANTTADGNLNKPKQEEHKIDPQVPVVPNCESKAAKSKAVRWKAKDSVTIDQKETFEQDEAFHRDLDYVLDAFRALRDKNSRFDDSSIRTEPLFKPMSDSQTSPLGRLASQYNRDRVKIDSKSLFRAYSTRSAAPRDLRSASLSASKPIHV